MKKLVLLLPLAFTACYQGQRDCKDFRTGTFKSEITINGVKHETVSRRSDTLVIETYKGKTDTASIRWVNDCEYVLRKLHPKNMAEEKAIAIKIMNTTKDGYTFEFGVVGDPNRQKGSAVKVD